MAESNLKREIGSDMSEDSRIPLSCKLEYLGHVIWGSRNVYRPASSRMKILRKEEMNKSSKFLKKDTSELFPLIA